MNEYNCLTTTIDYQGFAIGLDVFYELADDDLGKTWVSLYQALEGNGKDVLAKLDKKTLSTILEEILEKESLSRIEL